MADIQVVTVRGEDELAARAGQLFADVRREFLCAATDMNTWSRPRTREAIASRMRLAGDRVAVRKLVTSAALGDEEQRRHLLAVAATGAQVRVSGAALPHETIIVDRRVMILAGAPAAGDREFTVTGSAALIDGVYALFDAAWQAAVELSAYLHEDLPSIDPPGRAVLRVLGDGLTDEAAARRLGMSLRTYRRRVAELLRLLDSSSRFQAGVRAGERGLAR